MTIDEVMKEFDEKFSEKGYKIGNEHHSFPYFDNTSLKEQIKSFLRTHLENCLQEARQDERRKCADEVDETMKEFDYYDAKCCQEASLGLATKWRTEK